MAAVGVLFRFQKHKFAWKYFICDEPTSPLERIHWGSQSVIWMETANQSIVVTNEFSNTTFGFQEYKHAWKYLICNEGWLRDGDHGPMVFPSNDLDADGKPDLAIANVNDNTVSIFRNTSNPDSITTGSLCSKGWLHDWNGTLWCCNWWTWMVTANRSRCLQTQAVILFQSWEIQALLVPSRQAHFHQRLTSPRAINHIGLP